MVELVEERTLHSKVYDLGGGKRRVRCSIASPHVPADIGAWQRGDPVTWEETDHTFLERASKLELTKGWFGLELLGTRQNPQIGYRYTSKLTGGVIEVSLFRVGEIAASSLTIPAPRVVPAQVWFDHVLPGLHIYIQVVPGRVEIYKKLDNDTVPRTFVWRIAEQLPSTIPLSTATHGFDNSDGLELSRAGLGSRRRRREIQIMHSKGPDDLTTRPGWRIFRVTETWTGMTIVRNEPLPPSLSPEVVYPVLIDQDITEPIAADNDDGSQYSYNSWTASYLGSHFMDVGADINHQNIPGYRFTTVAIPQGATIDAASLTVKIEQRTGAPAGVLYGNDVDSAPAWTNSAGPFQMPLTTASVAFVPTASGTTYTVTITTIVQELVNRGAWVSGGDLAMGLNGLNTGTGNCNIFDFAHATEPAPYMTADYTAGGATVTPPRPQMNYAAVRRASNW